MDIERTTHWFGHKTQQQQQQLISGLKWTLLFRGSDTQPIHTGAATPVSEAGIYAQCVNSYTGLVVKYYENYPCLWEVLALKLPQQTRSPL